MRNCSTSQQAEIKANSISILHSIAAGFQALQDHDRPASKDFDDLSKAIHALRKAEALIGRLGSAGQEALVEAAHNAVTCKDDQFAALRPIGTDAVRIVADQIATLTTDLERGLATVNADDARPKPGAPAKTEAREFAEALCRCYEELSGKSASLWTDNKTGEKRGPCLDFVRDTFALFGVTGSEVDLVRAFARGRKTSQKT